MQQELQLTLTVIGGLVIIGVLLHGLWTTRKHKKKNKRADYESRNWEPGLEHVDDLESEGPIYDDVGVGQARVIINPSPPEKKPVEKDPTNTKPSSQDQTSTLGASDKDIDEAVNDDGNVQMSPAQVFATDEQNVNLEHPENINSESSANDNVIPLDSAPSASVENLFDEKLKDDALGADADAITSIATESNDGSGEASQIAGQGASENDLQSEVTLDNDEVKQSSPTPMYSNVVTQPKPEFTKPLLKKDASEDNMGSPPNFLLKKSDDQAQKTNSNVNPDDKNTSNKQSGNDAKATPDFSLNIQEGPIKKELSEAPPAANPEQEANKNKEKEPEKNLSLAEQARRFVRRNKKTVAEKIRKEPVLKNKVDDEQMRIDFDDNDMASSENSNTADKKPEVNTNTASNNDAQVQSQNEAEQATDVLVLNVRASDENPIQGASLLPMLLTLGFKFGEHDIFHRHVNTNGKGPILFSLTNMFKPGVFDIDNIETFSTYGLSLFMMLPIEGDAQQVFNMMHNAARKLSQEFDCRILDGNKVGLSKQSLQQYVERIREFERKRVNR